MRILIAEDDRLLRQLLFKTLEQWGHEMVVANNGQEAWEALQKPDCPRLAIMDWMMPGLEGPQVCKRARDNGMTNYLILLTSKGRREHIVEGLESGADDYVHKPFNPPELKARIRVGERIINLQNKLANLSMTDALTQIANRRRYEEVLNNEWERAVRQNGFLTAIMIDIDSFKLYNDDYGHAAGDACLRQVAQALNASAQRAGDFLARYGGEEFMVLAPSANDVKAAMEMAENLRASIENLKLKQEHSRSNKGVVTVSLGVAFCQATQNNSHRQLTEQADKALYAAKESGGNCYRTAFTASGHENVALRSDLS